VFDKHCRRRNVENPENAGLKAAGKSLLCWMICNDGWRVLWCGKVIQLLTDTCINNALTCNTRIQTDPSHQLKELIPCLDRHSAEVYENTGK